MGLSGWISAILSAVAGLYLISVELGLKEKTPLLYLGLFLLVPLIILVILAIIFREQVKIWFFRFKSKLSFGKGSRPLSGRPSMPPPSSMPMFQRQMQILPIQNMPMRRPAPAPARRQEDSVFEETMKKLKDMSK